MLLFNVNIITILIVIITYYNTFIVVSSWSKKASITSTTPVPVEALRSINNNSVDNNPAKAKQKQPFGVSKGLKATTTTTTYAKEDKGYQEEDIIIEKEHNKELTTKRMKNIIISYILWFTSGIFGLHHVYLGRIDRAITYVLSFGGFGLLALTDMFCIPTKYVREYDALNDIEYIETIKVQQKYNKNPKLPKVLPILLQLYVGSLLGILCGCVIPEELYSDKIYYLLQAIGLSIGIYIAGTSQCNTSFISSSFTNVIASCIIVKMFVMFILAPYTNFIRMNDTSLCWIAGVIAFRYSAYWNIDLLESVTSNNETHEKRKIKQQQNQKGISFLKRLLQYIIIINLIITCVISGIYNYGTVQILNAHTNQYELHKVKDAFHNMIKSQGFKDFKRTFNKFYNDFKTNHDYKESWEKLKEDFDPDGEKRALRILELNDNDNDNLTQQEIKSAYKRLVLMYHPDRYQQQQQNNNGDNNYNQYCDQNCAQEKFIEIQEAYEILSKKKTYSSR